MKAIMLDAQMKQKLIEEYKEKLKKEAGEKLSAFSAECDTFVPPQQSVKADTKLKIYYTAAAYAKIVQLVFAHSQEIGWNMVVKPYNGGYRVEDVLVYPQKPSGAYIAVDLNRYAEWRADPDKVSDDADRNLFGQGHSHVNMDTIPSGTDREQQKNEVQLKGSGFYLFQIWNKKLDVNSFFYDIDNNIYYERGDIELIVEDGNTTSDKFIAESREMLIEEPHPITKLLPKSLPPVKQKKKGQKEMPYNHYTRVYEEDYEEKEHSFFDGYWPGYGYRPEYDW